MTEPLRVTKTPGNGWWENPSEAQRQFGVDQAKQGFAMQPHIVFPDADCIKVLRYISYIDGLVITRNELALAIQVRLELDAQGHLYDKELYLFEQVEHEIEIEEGCGCCGIKKIVTHYVYKRQGAK